jgi:parvulin-like peptidyl-prolyl isomerase
MDSSKKKTKNSKRKKISPNTAIGLAALTVIIILAVVLMNLDKIFPSSEGVAARVNGEEITVEEINERYEALPPQYKQLLTKEQFLNQTVQQMLLLQEADKQGITVSDDEVQIVIGTFLQQNGLTQEQFEELLAQENKSLEEMFVLYKEQLKVTKLLNQTIMSDVEVSDTEVEDFYNNNPQYFELPEQVKASHILICGEGDMRCESDLTQQEAKELADEIKDMVTKDNFGELAKEHSTGPSAVNEGDLGFFGRGMMVKEFEDVAFSLDIGEVSEPVKTDFGYHIIKVTDKQEASKQSFEEVEEQIKFSLLQQKQQAVLITYINQLMAKANVEIFPLIGSNPATLNPTSNPGISTFRDSGDELCTEDGKPIIRLFSTTTCPHCKWIKGTFDSVAKEYVEQGKIVAYHWELDTKDDTLTEEAENDVPVNELALFQKYDPQGGVPAFVFGCKYVRIGNAYEAQNDLAAEEAEFRNLIEELIK